MGTLPVGIIGGGIVGLAVAREITRRYPGVEVAVFEKEPELATHQTGHNSGVVHAGIYYEPGSLKAQLCARGRTMLEAYCAEHGLPYRASGKVVVAIEESELERLDALEARATANRVPGLKRLGPSEITDIEPHVAGIAALHSPSTAITDFRAIANQMARDVEEAGGTIHLGTRVHTIRRRGQTIDLQMDSWVHHVGRLVICAGLQADRIGRQIDGQADPRIVPFRGEYMAVSAEKQDMVNGMVYPVPDPQYPFLGVHFTRTVAGELEIGPNAVLALDREGYRRYNVSARDISKTLRHAGFWRLAARNWQAGVEEIWGSMSTRTYMRRASRYIPDIGPGDVKRSLVGIRAQAVGVDGSLVDDFRIYAENGVVSVRNAPSPAATASLAIAEHIVDQLDTPA